MTAAASAGRRRYPGVRAFEEADAVLFYGRQAAADQLLLRVLSVRLLLQFAPSGVGKTSLLQAGLFPPLRGHEAFPFIARINRPEETLVAAVRRSLLEACERQGLQDPVVPEAAADLGALLAGTQLWSPDASLLTPVLVLDQFEEIFTLRDEDFRRDLARQVGALVGVRPGGAGAPAVKIILSLREEFLGRLEQFSRDIPELFAERLRLPPLTGEEARRAIVEPAARDEAGWASPPFSYAPECVTELVDFIDGSSEQAPVVEPLTLQLVCAHGEDIVLKRAAAGQPQAPLTMADFGGIEGLRRLVADHYERELARLPAARRKPARAMFERGLLDPAGKRLMLEEGEIQRDHGLARADLDLLVEGRLLRREPRNDSLFYEIGHDRLAEAIARRRGSLLPRWVKPALAVAALLVVGLAAGALYFRDLQEQAETNAEEARKAQAEAERAYGLLLGDRLVERLREAGASDAIREVMGQLNQADTMPAVPPIVKLMRLEGDLELQRGTLAGARGAFEQGLSRLGDKEAHASAPRAVDAERANLLMRLGDVEWQSGQLEVARGRLQAATLLWDHVLGAEPTLEERLDASTAHTMLASLLVRMDERPAAETPAGRALELALAAWIEAHADAQHTETDMGFVKGRAARALTDAVLARANVWGNDSNAYAVVEALSQEAWRIRPFSAQASRSAAVAGSNLAQVQSDASPTPPPALRNAARQLERLLRTDHDDRRNQREYAAVRVVLAEHLIKCLGAPVCRRQLPPDRLLEVRADLLDAVGTLRWLSSLDDHNQGVRQDLVWALILRARLLDAQGDPAQALPVFDEALLVAKELRERETGLAGIDYEATAQVWRADLLHRLGRRPESEQARAAALAALTAMPEPDRPRWLTVNVLSDLARGLRTQGRKDEAAALEQRAQAANEVLGTPWVQAPERATAHNERAIALVQQATEAAPAAALPLLAQALVAQRDSVRENPFDVTLWRNLRVTYEWIANKSREPAPGLDAKQAGAEHFRALASAMAVAQLVVAVGSAPADRQADRAALADIRRDLVLHLRSTDQPGPAMTLARDAAARARESSVEGRVSNQDLVALRDAYVTLGWQRAASGLGGWQEPIAVALELGRRLTVADPGEPDHWRVLGVMHGDLARAGAPEWREAALREAEAACRKALQLASALKEPGRAREWARLCLDELAAGPR